MAKGAHEKTLSDCSCPRCNYDVSGEVSRWNSDTSQELSCPLFGTCPECGLQFEWRYVIDPRQASLRWFVESDRLFPLPRKRFAWWRTMVRACVPWIFWRDVKLETPMRTAPRAWWFIAMLFASVIGAALVRAIPAFVDPLTPRMWWRGNVPYWRTVRQELTRVDALDTVLSWFKMGDTLPWMIAALVGFIMYPFVLLCLPWTRKLSKVHTRHVWRASAYAAAPLGVLACVAILKSAVDPIFNYFTMGGMSWMRDIDPYRPNGNWWARMTWSEISVLHNALWIATILWLALWWTCALKLGFRMQDWKRVSLALIIPSVLAQVLLLYTNLKFTLFIWQ